MIIGKRLEDLPAYVELGEDPVNLLPPAFTICSTAMALTGDIVFFTLLDEQGKQVLSVHLSNDEVRKNGRRQSNPAIFVVDSASLALPVLGLVFPQSWVRSCLAVSTYSGLVQWVAEGEVVTNRTYEVLTQEGVFPQALAGKLLLGIFEYGGQWYASSGKISNLNIFSSALSIEAMKEITSGGSGRQGDYLAWENMKWNLHGQAFKKKEQKLSHSEKNVLLFHTKFQSMVSCMQLCQKLGTRAPSVVTPEEWSSLHSFLKQELFDRVLNNSLMVWVPAMKKDEEWRDFYSSELIQYEAPTIDGSWWENLECMT